MLLAILGAEFLWFMADNALGTYIGNYVIYYLNSASSSTMIFTIVGGVASVVGFATAGSIADRIGVTKTLTLTADSADRIRSIAGSGCLPGIPVTIGDGLQSLTDRYHLVTDPDVYEGGRMFTLEGGCFRRVYLLTDFLSEDWENSVVQGIRMDRGNLAGLCIGSTSSEEWRMLLGEPDYTVAYDEQKAEINRTVPGECDYYPCGAYQLRLQSDQDGILYSIILTE